MARLNIEQKWWSDRRRERLIEKVGSAFLADGLAIAVWRISQDHGAQPFEAAKYFEPEHIVAICACGLATAKQGLLYVAGAEEHHAWIINQRERAKKGGEARANKINKKPVAKAKQTLSKALPSLLFTLKEEELSTSYLGEANASANQIAVVETGQEIKNPPGYFIAAYRKAFQARYPGAQPDVRGKVQGQIKTLLKDYPVEQAVQLVQVFCQMDGANNWFSRKGHDFGTFLENLNPVRIALAAGFDTSKPSEPDWEKICGRAS